MTTLICKPQNVQFDVKEANGEMIFGYPHYLGVAYARDGGVHAEKFTQDKINTGFDFLEKLKKEAFIAFLFDKNCKLYNKDIENMPPVAIHEKLAFVSAGDLVTLTGKTKKTHSTARHMKEFAFEEMEKSNPNIFFTYSGMWLLERVIHGSWATLAFIKGNGSINVLRQSDWEIFKEMRYWDSELVKEKYNKKQKFWSQPF